MIDLRCSNSAAILCHPARWVKSHGQDWRKTSQNSETPPPCICPRTHDDRDNNAGASRVIICPVRHATGHMCAASRLHARLSHFFYFHQSSRFIFLDTVSTFAPLSRSNTEDNRAKVMADPNFSQAYPSKSQQLGFLFSPRELSYPRCCITC